MPGWSPAAQNAFELNVNNYYNVASFALLYYDYLLTIDQEIKFFWGRRITFVSGLFFTCRYLSLAANIPIILQTVENLSPNVITLLTRTYALYGRSRRILALTCVTFVFALVFGVCMITKVPLSIDGGPGCGVSVDDATGHAYGIAWIGIVVFDTEILILTAWKTYNIFRVRKSLGMVGTVGERIAYVFLRDECTYYGVLTIANLSQILTLLYCPPLLKGLSTNFVAIMAVIVISRLMLNLREPDAFAPTPAAELGTLVESCCTHQRHQEVRW
ncbi:hypothetical protein BD410DRAFT_495177 [Rickenella mellea]|uniref:DUF6533 domain-containing protein n=1 Tax=Rickenella mellea TaxID=50990 RepID=A0A4Y7PSW5_9AGAM|nr:hypothetical protein BD410DRAFT_495177 [Rickenella mellea]